MVKGVKNLGFIHDEINQFGDHPERGRGGGVSVEERQEEEECVELG
jgi:hypothetical protein